VAVLEANGGRNNVKVQSMWAMDNDFNASDVEFSHKWWSVLVLVRVAVLVPVLFPALEHALVPASLPALVPVLMPVAVPVSARFGACRCPFLCTLQVPVLAASPRLDRMMPNGSVFGETAKVWRGMGAKVQRG
jgi:hypothetical protein